MLLSVKVMLEAVKKCSVVAFHFRGGFDIHSSTLRVCYCCPVWRGVERSAI